MTFLLPSSSAVLCVCFRVVVLTKGSYSFFTCAACRDVIMFWDTDMPITEVQLSWNSWYYWNFRVVLKLSWNQKLSGNFSHLVRMSWYWRMWPCTVLIRLLHLQQFSIFLQITTTWLLLSLIVQYCVWWCILSCFIKHSAAVRIFLFSLCWEILVAPLQRLIMLV